MGGLMLTRRELTFGSTALALGLAARSRDARAANGPALAVQCVSFIMDHSAKELAPEIPKLGLRACEFHYENFLPRKGPPSRSPALPMTGPEQRRWLMSLPMSDFADMRTRFEKAGVAPFSYYYDVYRDSTEEELARPFAMAKALGVTRLSCTTHVGAVDRVEALAKAQGITVGLHNQSPVADDRLTTAEDFERALKGRAPHVKVTLDTGHFAAMGGDPVSFIDRHHDRIMALHLKDRKKGQVGHGHVVPFGTGDARIADVLRLVEKRALTFPIFVEYEDMPSVAALSRCLEFARKSLA
jgi:sugar phosphate isomerase/epimerase